MNSCSDLSACAPANTAVATPTRHSIPAPQFLRPRANITSSEEGYVVSLDLPGVKRENLEISFENSELTIVGRRPAPAGDATVLHRESRTGDFRRVFELDANIDATRIGAKLEDGVLTLTLPKAERARARKIEIAA